MVSDHKLVSLDELILQLQEIQKETENYAVECATVEVMNGEGVITPFFEVYTKAYRDIEEDGIRVRVQISGKIDEVTEF